MTQQQPTPEVIPLSDTWRDAKMVGDPVHRLDGPAKVRGQAKYAYEYRGAGEAAYGWIVEATIAKGQIVAIDTKAAESAPGVLMVMTHANAPQQGGPPPRPTQPNRFDRPMPVLFQPAVRYHGEPVALVVAETLEAARAAAALVAVRYAPDRATVDFERNRDKAYKPANRINAFAQPDTSEGDFAGAFAAAPVKIDATYVTSYEHNMPMEPHAAIAEWQGDRLTLWSAQQNLGTAVGTIAKTLLIPPENIRVLSPFIGGGFGSKVPVTPNAILTAMAAKRLGRPVKIAQTRQQMFANTAHRPLNHQRVRLGAERDGRLTAFAHDVIQQTTPYDEFIEQTATFGRGMYQAANRLTTSRGVMLDMPSGDIMRAPGEQPGSFALESAMDELAHALKMDPVELRLINEPARDPEGDKPFSSRSLVACLKEGAAKFGWAERPSTPGSLRQGDWLVGFGMAAATFPAFVRPASAMVELTPDGTAIGRADFTDLGTGSWTSMAQILAQETGLPVSRVKFEIGDSRFPRTAGSGGSFGMTSAGAGVHRACENLRAEMGKRAGASGAVRLAEGRVHWDGQSQPLAEFMRRYAPKGLSAHGGQGGLPPPEKLPVSAHSYGAQFVEIGVHRVTFELRIRRALGAFAAGRIINERLARSQLLGGMIMGIGSGLHEESVVDPRHGQFVNRDLAEYHIPVHADIRNLDVLFIPEREEVLNPLGTKGLGEIGIVGVSAAIANAVFNATGVRVRAAPVTLDKLVSKQNHA
ncbi:xanthine dehydrogenase family protein molybdopterin-binding subunit [Sphingomonas sp. DT-207]|uniref:xanthine dehydrogenase family protein molybdopterin-binding subunit n=1 Tax=Sphingomonas sp. DT-207 TaxID=3396167 RepID=UPI003F1E4683